MSRNIDRCLEFFKLMNNLINIEYINEEQLLMSAYNLLSIINYIFYSSGSFNNNFMLDSFFEFYVKLNIQQKKILFKKLLKNENHISSNIFYLLLCTIMINYFYYHSIIQNDKYIFFEGLLDNVDGYQNNTIMLFLRNIKNYRFNYERFCEIIEDIQNCPIKELQRQLYKKNIYGCNILSYYLSNFDNFSSDFKYTRFFKLINLDKNIIEYDTCIPYDLFENPFRFGNLDNDMLIIQPRIPLIECVGKKNMDPIYKYFIHHSKNIYMLSEPYLKKIFLNIFLDNNKVYKYVKNISFFQLKFFLNEFKDYIQIKQKVKDMEKYEEFCEEVLNTKIQNMNKTNLPEDLIKLMCIFVGI